MSSPIVVVMGVSACGKSSVAARVAARLGVPWRDADDLHPPANLLKMAAGTPLTDDDRWPWLDAVSAVLAEGAAGDGVIVACSALRRSYRDRLRQAAPGVAFIHLHGTADLLAERARARADHFMPPSLLTSQLETLEALGEDENGVVIDVADAVDVVAATAFDWIEHHD
jgi:gluconokinase